MKKQQPFYLFWLVWLFGLMACRQDAAAPTLTPVPTSDATMEAIAEGQNPPFYNGLAAWGGRVYFGYGRDLYWLDVAEPMNPVMVGSLTLPNRLSRISLQGDEAHLILNTPDFFDSPSVADGWQRVDLANPSRPQLTTFYDAYTNLYRVALYRDTAYLATANEGLLILDVTDAAAPHTLAPFTDLSGPISELAIFDHYLLVMSAVCFRNCTSTLNILDVSTPQQPQLVSRFTHSYGYFPTLLIHDPYVTLVGNPIVTLDLSTPETPQRVGELSVAEYVLGAVLRDGWLYVVGQGLLTFDMSDVAQPRLVHQVNKQLHLSQVVIDGELLAVLAPQEGVLLYSLADAAAPQELAHYQLAASR